HIAKSPSVFRVPVGDWQAATKKVIEIIREKREMWEKWNKDGKSFVKNYGWEKIAKQEFEILSSFWQHNMVV
ncbi:MAG: hypothetical protein ACD_83C00095G0001, partial [uncultured bacterium]